MRRERGPAHCLGLLATSRRPCEMDAALVGNQSRRIEHRGSCERQYDWARSKKNEIKPHLVQQWVIPPQASSAFVAAMEDVLAVYKRPRDGDGPLVCLDETSKQLLAGTRAPIPIAASMMRRVKSLAVSAAKGAPAGVVAVSAPRHVGPYCRQFSAVRMSTIASRLSSRQATRHVWRPPNRTPRRNEPPDRASLPGAPAAAPSNLGGR